LAPSEIATGEPASGGTRLELQRIAGRLGVYVGAFALLWSVLYATWSRFPYVRNGTDVIVAAKLDEIDRGAVFRGAPEGAARVIVLGDSRVLSGFVPEEFDRQSGGRTFSYNAGLPGRSDFVENLDRILHGGNRPTHVFLTLPIPPISTDRPRDPSTGRVLWPPERFKAGPFKWFASDEAILDAICPFRGLPRDLFTFALLARRRGGMAAFYEQAAGFARRVVEDRGYYFIEGQKLFPDGRLPDAYALATDDRTRPFEPQQLDGGSPELARMAEWARTYGFAICFIPAYRRDKADAPPAPVDETTVRAAAPHPEIRVVGPNYFQYPNRLFSDAVHLNPEGAKRYTGDLWRATEGLLFAEPPRERRP
jgi:hypothetical protein